MKTHIDQLSGTGIRAVSRFFMHLVYRIGLLRIAHGFSQEDLSILLGYEPGRIGCIERFETGYGYVQKDLLRLSEVLRCPLEQFFERAAHDISIIKVNEQREAGTIVQEVFEIKPDGTELLRYRLMEIDRSIDTPGEAVKMKTKGLIHSLIHAGYFDTPWETSEIFDVCRQAVGRQLTPLLLAQLLASFTTNNTAVRLARLESEHHCCWVALPQLSLINS